MRFLLGLLVFLHAINMQAGENSKTVLSHEVYDDWKSIFNPHISNNGLWVSYEIRPYTGDGFLVLYNTNDSSKDTIPRAYLARFSPLSDYIVFHIRPEHASVRQAKIDKTPRDDMPRDTIGFYHLETKQLQLYPDAGNFKIPEEESAWFAFTAERLKKSKDNENNCKKNTPLYTLHMVNPSHNKHHQFDYVSDFYMSADGSRIAFLKHDKKNCKNINLVTFDTSNERKRNIFKGDGVLKNIVLDEQGKQMVFIYSEDTTDVKNYFLYHHEGRKRRAKKILDDSHSFFSEQYVLSEHADLRFSENGRILYFGYAAEPIPKPQDSLPDDEIVQLDLWSWTDDVLQSRQLVNLNRERKKSYTAAYHIEEQAFVRLANEQIPHIRTFGKGNASNALGISDLPYRLQASWEPSYRDYYLVNVMNGKAEKVLEQHHYTATLSPSGNYLVYYNTADSLWYAYSAKNKTHKALTENIAADFYNTDFDRPNAPPPYGIAGWIEGDSYVLIYDKYDIWKIPLQANPTAVNLTKNVLPVKSAKRIVKLDRDADYFPGDKKLLIKYVIEADKSEGFFYLDLNNNEASDVKLKGDFRFYGVQKAKDADVFLFRRSSFVEFPDLWTAQANFENPRKISLANPQQEDYWWGSVEIIEWTYENKTYKGLLYKPENFDSTASYPMITYFYERNTQNIHRHYIPNPSRSVINFPFYTSRGYLIFVPDIDYEIGFPGESANKAVIGGVHHLLSKGYADPQRLGLQGQSWGGYQVAYIITRTRMFSAAMAGAPVSNMTSAYGGIRRTSGINRIHQYEIGQSRIGSSLWENLENYIDNSPLFFADRVETPLLMMHNDKDGAVPWQQGKELFLALRRLEKPVWLLNYNNDGHNLTRKPNRLDLSIRMQQFFDHYLKNKPKAEWMKYGIDAIEKGHSLKYELVE